MTNRVLRLLAAASLLASLSGAARAEEGAGTVYSKDGYPYAELTKQPLTLAAGLLRLDVPVAINLSKDLVGKPWSIPAALALGVTDDLEIGVFHRTGLCLAGTANGCSKVYDDVGGRAALGLVRDAIQQLAIQVDVLATDFADPQLAGAAALEYKRTAGNMAVVVAAGFQALLNKRSAAPVKDSVVASGELQLQLAEGLAAFGRIGVQKLLDVPSGADSLLVPVTVGIEVEPIRKLDVGAELTFGNLLGEGATVDEREGLVYARLFF